MSDKFTILDKLLQLSRDTMACVPLLFAKPVDIVPKNVNKIRIAEVVIGSIITSIIIGSFALYTTIIILREKTNFFETQVKATISEMKENRKEFENFEAETRAYQIRTDHRFEEINKMIREEQWLRNRTQ